MADTQDTTAPSMPVALQEVVVRSLMAASGSNVAVLPSLASLQTRSLQPVQPPPDPTPTVRLLERIDDLHAAYVRLVEVTCLSLQSAANPSGATDGSEQQSAASQTLEKESAEAAATLAQCAADIQAGIRSKVQQTARIALIGELRAEVARRRAAVAKMESTLGVANKYL